MHRSNDLEKTSGNSLFEKFSILQAFQSPPFTLLWLGQTISMMGDTLFSLALAWKIVMLTGSAAAMGLVVVAQIVPTMIFVLLGGVIADRMPRKLIMLWSDMGRAGLVLIIAVLEWFQLLQFWHLFLLALCFGIADAFFAPASRSIAPQLVKTEALGSANSLSALSRQFSQSVGPLLAALCLSFAGIALAFGLDAVSFLISAACLIMIRIPSLLISSEKEIIDKEPTSLLHSGVKNLRLVGSQVKEGFYYVKKSPWIWVTILLVSFANIGYAAPITVILPILIRDVYHAGPWLLGIIGTVGAIGGIAGTIIIGQIQRRLKHRGIIAYLAVALSSVAIIAFALPYPDTLRPILACVASFLANFSLSTFSIIWITVLQELVPVEKLGRVSSIEMLGTYSLLPLGFVLMGVLSDSIGPSWVFIGGGGILLIIAFIGLSLRDIQKLQ